MSFAIELTRSEANERCTSDDRYEVEEWLDSLNDASIRDLGEGPWNIQLIRWEGESFSVLTEHGHSGRAEHWTPPTPPPALLMRYGRKVTV